jgi:PhnB protein
MQSNTYLNFNGDCQAAFKLYEQCLGGKIAARPTENHRRSIWHTVDD